MAGNEMLNSQKNPFTRYYGQLQHQQNMLQDAVRSGTYRHAFLTNAPDFLDKVVLDVGTGTGILAFFAIQAGARKVYAIEASDMAAHASALVHANGLSDRIIVRKDIVEDMELPEQVDIIISEPIGFLLVHERMLETYIVARDRWLKPGGIMLPTTGTIVLVPFTDEALHTEQSNKSIFWQAPSFYGVDLTSLRIKANDEYFSQPVVGYFHTGCLVSSHYAQHTVDFQTISCAELQHFEIPFSFFIERTALIHGLAAWFDIDFKGSVATVVLSTAPNSPGTHWYQCRLLLPDPIAVNRSQSVSGTLRFDANDSFSYDLLLTMQLDGTHISSTNRIYLQDQMYHYLSNPTSAMAHVPYQPPQHIVEPPVYSIPQQASPSR